MWTLWGCAGAVVLGVALLAAGLFALGTAITRTAARVGPVTPKSVAAALGPDLPVHPGSRLDPTTTQGLLTTLRLVESAAGRKSGSLFRGLAVLRSERSPVELLAWYDAALPKQGWRREAGAGEDARPSGQLQHTYHKGRELGIVQVERGDGVTSLVLMRGGPEMTAHLSQVRQERRRSAGEGVSDRVRP